METDNSSKIQLDPFSFPSETNVRFALLILAVFMIAISIGQPLRIISSLVLELTKGETLSEAMEPSELNAPDEESSLRSQALSGVSERLGILAITAGGLLVIFLLATAIYRTHPDRIRRRKKLTPLDPNQHLKLYDQVREIASQVDIPPPKVMLGGGLRSQSAQAFGVGKNPVLGLGGGVRLLLVKAPARFRALILHELAHFANRDIRPAYFSEALWRATLVVAVVPFLVILFGLSLVSAINSLLSGDIGGLFLIVIGIIIGIPVLTILFGLPLLVVVLIRAGLLRVREFYADWRSAQWGAGGALLDTFNVGASMEKNKRKLRLRFHPTAQQRLRVLTNSTGLFRVTMDLPLVTGFLIAFVVTGVYGQYFSASGVLLSILMASVADFVELAMSSSSILLVGIANLAWSAIELVMNALNLILLLGLSFLVAGTVGLQIQRETVAAKASRQQGYVLLFRLALAALLMTVGLEIGFLFIPPYTFSPLGALIGGLVDPLLLLLILPWMIGFILITYLGFLYTRYTASAILGSHASKSPPNWKLRLSILGQIIAFSALYLPLLVARLLILYPQDPLYIGLFQTSSVVGPILYVILFGATWLALQIRWLVYPARCPNCGKITQHKDAVGQNCEHCDQRLAPWLFVTSPTKEEITKGYNTI